MLCCICLATTVFAQEQEAELTPMEQLEQRTQSVEESVKALKKFKVSVKKWSPIPCPGVLM